MTDLVPSSSKAYFDALKKNGSYFSGATSFDPGSLTIAENAYYGSVYSPSQNRIYLCPRQQSIPYAAVPGAGESSLTEFWHYIDCSDGSIGTYLNPNNGVGNSYGGGAYSPTQNRIYFSPSSQAAPANAVWHYIDCSNGSVGTYPNPGGCVSGAYTGAVYSPIQDRIYFVPLNQGSTANAVWHYIDCSDGSVGTYPNPGTAVSNAYSGGIYSPIQNRIYFSPLSQGDPANTVWHYIDCSDGSVGTYPNPGGCTNGAYDGAIYSPTQNRIYFSPFLQALGTAFWHYIDCSDGSVVTYPNPGNAAFFAYRGGVYSPIENKIFFTPQGQSAPANAVWHYIDCNDGSIGEYANPGNAGTTAYVGGTYSPTQNRVYFAPYTQGNKAVWHFIDSSCNASTSKILMAGAEYNNT